LSYFTKYRIVGLIRAV